MYKTVWYCRWCGIRYRPKNPTERDGFCSSAHKQAWWRAFKKYVTPIPGRLSALLKSKSGSSKPSNARKGRKAK